MGKKIKIETVSDEQARQLWKKKTELSLEECLRINYDLAKKYKKNLLITIGEWLSNNISYIHTDELMEDTLNEDEYLKNMGSNYVMRDLMSNVYQAINFRYTLKFYGDKFKFFKTGDIYWALRPKRYKKLCKKFDEPDELYV